MKLSSWSWISEEALKVAGGEENVWNAEVLLVVVAVGKGGGDKPRNVEGVEGEGIT